MTEPRLWNDPTRTKESGYTVIRFQPDFNEPIMTLTYRYHTIELTYTMVDSLLKALRVDSHSTHFRDMSLLKKELHAIMNQMGSDATGVTTS